MSTLNLGILAHVDAGKTTLTERLLHAAGVIEEIGSVDAGTTQTDSMELERKRGITIKAAVVSFIVDSVTVNLIDTPGHPDFIAEVERSLHVLDGAVLVISAVEGVQAQTRVLMRTLQRLGIPTLLFVNKIDRRGADVGRVVDAIAEKLTPAIIRMGTVRDPGTRAAAFTLSGEDDAGRADALAALVAGHDDALLAAWVDDEVGLTAARLRAALAAQTRQGLVHPVFFGSALTGVGVQELMPAIVELLPVSEGDVGGPPSGAVFKVDRGAAGERIAYVRMFSGTIRTRDRLPVGAADDRKITGIAINEAGSDVERPAVAAGQIAKVRGLGDVRVGDVIGTPTTASFERRHFAPPTLEAVAVPARAGDKVALHAALDQLAEQDPLINVRQDDARDEIYVSLYGEVQKEVIQETLAVDFGVEVSFQDTTTICVERPAGTGTAVEVMRARGNPILATVGLRVEPAPVGSGSSYGIEGELHGSMPPAFHKAVEDTVHETLRQGLRGWEVTDCTVTMTHSGYAPRQSHAHQRFNRAMSSTGADFRDLTPLVLMHALKAAGTVVCEPIHRIHLEVPADALPTVLALITRLDGIPGPPSIRGSTCVLEGDIPAARVHELLRQVPSLTGGEGVLESAFDRYDPVRGTVPTRPRTNTDPLDRKEYLREVLRRP